MNRLACIGLLFSAFTAPAQTLVATVQDALLLARRQSPELVNARRNRLVATQQQTAIRANMLPQARFFTNFDYNYALPVQVVPTELFGGQPGEYRSIRFGLPYVLTAGAEITAPILNRPARADLAIVGQSLRITDQQTLVLQDELSTQTVRVYQAALLSRSAIALTRRNWLAADTLTQIARQRLGKGLIEPLEYNRIYQVQLTTADVLYQNELAYVRNVNQLKLLLGLAQTDSLVLSEELINRPAGLTVSPTDLPLIERPQISLQQARVDLSRLQLNRERLQRWPTLSVYGRFTEQAQRNEISFLNTTQPWYRIGVAGLQFNWAIYTGGLRTSNLTRARLQLQLDESELTYERNRQQTDTEDVRNAYNQAIRSLDVNRQNYELSSQNVRIALVKYRSGLFAYDQYLTVFNEALAAQNRFLTNLSNVFINQTILQIRSGQ